MKKYLISSIVVGLMLIAALVAVSPASAHVTTCATDHANLVNDVNADNASDSVTPDGVVTDSFDVAVANDQAQLIADGCGNTSGFGYGSFPGSFGARYFGHGFGFGALAAAQTSTDAEACSNTLAWLSTLDTNDKRQAIAAGIVSQLQACQGNTGSTPSSTSCGPFNCFGFGPGGWFRRF